HRSGNDSASNHHVEQGSRARFRDGLPLGKADEGQNNERDGGAYGDPHLRRQVAHVEPLLFEIAANAPRHGGQDRKKDRFHQGSAWKMSTKTERNEMSCWLPRPRREIVAKKVGGAQPVSLT